MRSLQAFGKSSAKEDAMDEANRIVTQLQYELTERGVKIPKDLEQFNLPDALDQLENLAVERYKRKHTSE